MSKARTLPMLLILAFVWCGQARADGTQDNFMHNCAVCHGPDGRAKTPVAKKLGVKNLVESKLDLPAIEKQITFGTKDAAGATKMPAFSPKLSSQEITGLAGYVKALQH